MLSALEEPTLFQRLRNEQKLVWHSKAKSIQANLKQLDVNLEQLRGWSPTPQLLKCVAMVKFKISTRTYSSFKLEVKEKTKIQHPQLESCRYRNRNGMFAKLHSQMISPESAFNDIFEKR